MPYQSLSELGSELDTILDYLDSDDADDLAVAEELLDNLMPQLATKIDGYAGAIAHYETISANIDAEISRLGTRKQKVVENRDRLKGRLKDFLEERVGTIGDRGRKLEGSLYRVSLAINGGKQPIHINPIASLDLVPPDLVSTTIVSKIDTDRLRDYFAANDTDELLDSAGNPVAKLYPRGKHLRIS